MVIDILYNIIFVVIIKVYACIASVPNAKELVVHTELISFFLTYRCKSDMVDMHVDLLFADVLLGI